MSRAGERLPHERLQEGPCSSQGTQGGGHHAGSDNRAEHWSVVCRSCDRRGLAAFGASPVSAEEIGAGNQVFFKGGFMNLNQDRGTQIFTDTNGVLGAGGVNGGNAGWYVGAGST
jgi:hypothetical protein